MGLERGDRDRGRLRLPGTREAHLGSDPGIGLPPDVRDLLHRDPRGRRGKRGRGHPLHLPRSQGPGGLNVATRAAQASEFSILEERLRETTRRLVRLFRELVRNRLALAGLVIIIVFLAISILAPVLVGPYPSPVQGAAT